MEKEWKKGGKQRKKGGKGEKRKKRKNNEKVGTKVKKGKK